MKRFASAASLACAMPKATLPSKEREMARSRGGISLLSEKRRQKDWADAVCIASAMNRSILPPLSCITPVSGKDSSAAFLAAATPSSLAAKGFEALRFTPTFRNG